MYRYGCTSPFRLKLQMDFDTVVGILLFENKKKKKANGKVRTKERRVTICFYQTNRLIDQRIQTYIQYTVPLEPHTNKMRK